MALMTALGNTYSRCGDLTFSRLEIGTGAWMGQAYNSRHIAATRVARSEMSAVSHLENQALG